MARMLMMMSSSSAVRRRGGGGGRGGGGVRRGVHVKATEKNNNKKNNVRSLGMRPLSSAAGEVGALSSPNWVFAAGVSSAERKGETVQVEEEEGGAAWEEEREHVSVKYAVAMRRRRRRRRAMDVSSIVKDDSSANFGLQRLSASEGLGIVLHAATGQSAAAVVYGERGAGVWPADDDTNMKAHTPTTQYSPRRTMAVQFTCNRCQTRTERRINPKAYTDGTIFVECSGCSVHHKLIDNLNLYYEGDANRRLEAAQLIEVFPRMDGKQFFKMKRLDICDDEGNE